MNDLRITALLETAYLASWRDGYATATSLRDGETEDERIELQQKHRRNAQAAGEALRVMIVELAADARMLAQFVEDSVGDETQPVVQVARRILAMKDVR